MDEFVLHGRGKSLPVVGVMFALGALGLVGLPPFGTFVGKTLMEHASDNGWITGLFLLASAISTGAVLRAAGGIFLGLRTELPEETTAPTEREKPEPPHKIPAVTLIVTGMLLLFACVTVFSPFSAQTHAAAQRFVDPPAYFHVVIKGEPAGSITPPEISHVGMKPILLSLAAAMGARAFSAIALFGSRLSRALRKKIRQTIDPLLFGLQTIHSGHVGDYVVWLVAGVAAVGAVFAIALHA